MSIDEHDLLIKFIENIKNNSVSVVWNMGLDSVIFMDRDVDGNKSLKTLINEILNDKSKESDNDI